MSIELDKVADDIYSKVKESLNDDWDTLSNFHKSQGRKLARQAALLAQLKLSGEVPQGDPIFETLIEQFEDAARNFAQAVANLTVLTLQNAWNAIAKTLWGAVNELFSKAGLGNLPVPGLVV
ncbi:hypothetical protein [Paracoccus sp. SCSIO 75233]|uniref:hypothetical protein n=1 Tax=Paracoccus sp. SCSIO 75233 TaxID=3017782 RepID=UPI0022F01E2C|nr:hypothetical protein [Paracoccus sp. SCSIO 75233]WBU53575.1 hypothetical protein PAF12_01680 [Paracoccus sp. SCSIO 75233]